MTVRSRTAFDAFPATALLVALLVAAFLSSMAAGPADIRLADIVGALLRPDDSHAHVVIRSLRLPRALAAMVTGAALAVAGAILQGLTQNPLASPGILGINAGAAFAVVLVTILFGSGSLHLYAWSAFAGAAAAAVAVYSLASFGRGGATPLKLTLAGAVFAAFLGSLTAAIIMTDAGTLDQVRLWTVGSLAGRQMRHIIAFGPYAAIGLVAAVLIARQISTLSLGLDVARSLGQRTEAMRGAAAAIAVMLAGSGVALAGPIGFVGLVAPHVARILCGTDYRRIIPLSALIGALLVLVADMAARTLVASDSLPVGVVMAMVGAPFFLYLARYRVRR